MPYKVSKMPHKRLKTNKEEEKNPTQKWINVVSCLRLATSTLHSTVAKEREIQENIDNVVTPVRKEDRRESYFPQV
jgi:hypothetical protein